MRPIKAAVPPGKKGLKGDNDMFHTRNSTRYCCTCSHWIGTRVVEEGGYVYSLKNLEGICNGSKAATAGTHFNRTLTLPDTSCTSWEKWPEIGLS